MAKILYLIREPRFVQPDEPLLQISKQKTMLYLFWQIFGITATLGVSQTIAGIGTFAHNILFSHHHPRTHHLTLLTMAVAAAQRLPPSQSLYLSNLPEKLQKSDLRRELYTLLSTYGPVLDINALRTAKMRGQAHVLFKDVQSATLAMRGEQGREFYGKDLVSEMCWLRIAEGWKLGEGEEVH